MLDEQMARKKIREFAAKNLLKRFITQYNPKFDYSKLPSFLLTNDSNFRLLKQTTPGLDSEKFVVKPDMLFGKRGKHNLVTLNKTFEESLDIVSKRLGEEVSIGSVKGKLTHFLVEKFLPHKDEYYLSMVSSRPGNVIRFSVAGGIDVEENWDKVKDITVDIDTDISAVDLTSLLDGVAPERVDVITEFIQAVYKVFVDLDFTLLEMNPFCFDESNGVPVPLDMHAELDDTALFKNRKKWQDIEFPNPFGRTETPEEEFVEELDSKTGASLKLTVLNPRGRIWTMIAGGGASVVFSDAIADAGFGSIMGNYGEYSGNPSEEETYQYAKTIIGLATRYPEDGRKALIIGGGIANFTDVAKTFKGITHAIDELQESLRQAQIKIFVRRGGPNYQTGLSMMRTLGHKLGLPIEVHGPEMDMTDIVPKAVNYIHEK